MYSFAAQLQESPLANLAKVRRELEMSALIQSDSSMAVRYLQLVCSRPERRSIELPKIVYTC